MLVNPGGPGGEGALFGASVYARNSAPMQAAYNVIGFDPRGIGFSTPKLTCDVNYSNAPRPEYGTGGRKDDAVWLKKSKAYADACARNFGAGAKVDLLDHIKTIDSVRDMDTIRAALGDKKLDYYGASYGTYLGSVYATMFPSHVRRMVLDSNVKPSDVWYDANLEQDKAFEGNINALFAWAAKYDSVYHLGTTQKAVRDFYFATRAKLAKAPAGGTVGGDELDDTYLVAGYIDEGGYWQYLVNALSQYKAGNGQALVDAYNLLGLTTDDNGYAVYNAVQCSDVQWPKSWDKWRRDNSKLYDAGYKFETWGNAWYNAPCLTWPAKAGKPVDVGHAKGVPPVLLFQATNDAATPVPGGVEMNQRLKGSRLVIEDGGRTHGVVQRGNACIDDKFNAFLTNGTLPANKSHCARLPEPVPPSGATAKAAAPQLFQQPLTRP
jgi:pimeloyl-ACP methyl ester carboxylesterase